MRQSLIPLFKSGLALLRAVTPAATRTVHVVLFSGNACCEVVSKFYHAHVIPYIKIRRKLQSFVVASRNGSLNFAANFEIVFTSKTQSKHWIEVPKWRVCKVLPHGVCSIAALIFFCVVFARLLNKPPSCGVVWAAFGDKNIYCTISQSLGNVCCSQSMSCWMYLQHLLRLKRVMLSVNVLTSYFWHLCPNPALCMACAALVVVTFVMLQQSRKSNVKPKLTELEGGSGEGAAPLPAFLPSCLPAFLPSFFSCLNFYNLSGVSWFFVFLLVGDLEKIILQKFYPHVVNYLALVPCFKPQHRAIFLWTNIQNTG